MSRLTNIEGRRVWIYGDMNDEEAKTEMRKVIPMNEPEKKPQPSPYENTAFVESQIRLAEGELAQYRQTAVQEIKFREGIIHALQQILKREPVLNESPPAPVAPAVDKTPPA